MTITLLLPASIACSDSVNHESAEIDTIKLTAPLVASPIGIDKEALSPGDKPANKKALKAERNASDISHENSSFKKANKQKQ